MDSPYVNVLLVILEDGVRGKFLWSNERVHLPFSMLIMLGWLNWWWRWSVSLYLLPDSMCLLLSIISSTICDWMAFVHWYGRSKPWISATHTKVSKSEVTFFGGVYKLKRWCLKNPCTYVWNLQCFQVIKVSLLYCESKVPSYCQQGWDLFLKVLKQLVA